ncbi:hypothetical protein A2215_02945 [Candidatus Berkelbacteria bacterium RIFOXYA2_FULL_43_10]|uniref:Uncharacterized protein n=1 Tax=Candidatus Berkelbacteria bacterium RIFOXYA2_FULL_43_10 TaxID=1797472 RepID=A0A1F5E4P6_9BACT|nr:MAG: hypothetical protein A2215_02945 [Candidatus Berkelbacteria bacterium RIFOXYA2_FULL_43_10]
MARRYKPESLWAPRRYRAVTETLVETYRAQIGPFHNNPQSPEMSIFALPQLDKPEKAIAGAFFLTSLLRGSIATVKAVTTFKNLVTKHPEVLDPTSILELGQSRLNTELEHAGLGFLSTYVVGDWIRNATILAKEQIAFVDLVTGFRDFQTAHFVMSAPRWAGGTRRNTHLRYYDFYGMGGTGKVLTLFLQMLMDQKLIPRFNLPVLTDIHLLRIFTATRAVKTDSGSILAYTLARMLRDLSLSKHPRDDPRFNVDLSRATYRLGQKFCSRHPQMTATPIPPEMRSKVGKKSPYTPIGDLLGKRSDDMGKCVESECPLRKWCRDIVPSGAFYECQVVAPARLLKPWLEERGLT